MNYNYEYDRFERVSLTIFTLKKIGIKGEIALVVGCSYGFEVEALYKYGFKEVYGLDISEYAISKAKELYSEWKDKFVVGDVENIPFKDETFDFVYAADILEHTFNPVRALREIYRVLKPEGKVYVRVPNTFAISLYNLLPKILKKLFELTGHNYNPHDPTHYSELPFYRWEYFFMMIGFKYKRLKIEEIYLRGSKRILGKAITIEKPFWLQVNLHYLLVK